MSGWEHHNVCFRLACLWTRTSLIIVLSRWRLWTEECPVVDDKYASEFPPVSLPRLWVTHLWAQGSHFPFLEALQFQDGRLWETFVPSFADPPPTYLLSHRLDTN